jgi:hypothetical protein
VLILGWNYNLVTCTYQCVERPLRSSLREPVLDNTHGFQSLLIAVDTIGLTYMATPEMDWRGQSKVPGKRMLPSFYVINAYGEG